MGYAGDVISIFIAIYLLQQVSIVHNRGLVKFWNIFISNGTAALANGNCSKSDNCSIVFDLCLMAYDGENVCLISGNSSGAVTSPFGEMLIKLSATYGVSEILYSEGVTRRCSVKKVFLKIYQNP